MAKTNKNKIKQKVSKLLAVTLLTPNRIVRSSFPCEVLKLVLRTKAMQPLSAAKKKYIILAG